MALMMSSLYDALRAANVDDEKARKAAEEVANYEEKLNQYDKRFTALDGRLNLLQWMVGFNLAATVAILFRLLTKS
ncbi:integrase [Jiella avicenniae]|uniref:Integrase n=1 Tax=Jiella avicenniae TaxID=2907202 RepID=A0A9X1T3T3_9HYPH|nr:integrase [Jiella avicenniae]MCE7026829.1 integrase [Jiella avicenniae]